MKTYDRTAKPGFLYATMFAMVTALMLPCSVGAALIGGPNDNAGGDSSGSAYVFGPPPPPTGVGATVFLSPVAAVGGGAALANPELTVEVGERVRLGVWVSTAVGLDVDQMALDLVETAGILDANGMTLAEAVLFTRWHTIINANLNVSPQELFSDSRSTGGLGGTYGLTGIGPFRTLDANFDPAAADGNGAFLYAIIEFTPTAEGDTDLYLKVGRDTIIYDAGDPASDTAVHFGAGDDAIWRTIPGAVSFLPDATIHVVPEPATLVLLGVVVPAFLRRKRRPS